MSGREIAKLSCRILSIYTMVRAIGLIIMSLASMAVGQNGNFSFQLEKLIYSVPFALIFLLGLFLWLASERLAFVMFSDFETQEEHLKFSIEDLKRTAFCTLGLFFIGLALPGLVSSFINLKFIMPKYGYFMQPTEVAKLIETTIQLLLGIGMFAGSKGLVRILGVLRETGPGKRTEYS